jgi:hypothetical protein
LLTIAGQFATTSVISPTAFTGARVDNFNPTGLSTASVISQDASADTMITGLTAQPTGTEINWHNVSTCCKETFKNSDSIDSSVGNLFTLTDATDLTLTPGGAVTLRYNGTAWRPKAVITGSPFGAPIGAWSNWQSGRYYHPINTPGPGTIIGAQNTLRCHPFIIPNAVTLQKIGVDITTIGEAGSQLRLGIYADDNTGRPGALEIDSGQIDGTVIAKTYVSISTALPAGKHHECIVAQACATTCPTYRTATGADVPTDAGSSAPSTGIAATGFQQILGSNSLPNPFQGTTSINANPAFLDVQVQ